MDVEEPWVEQAVALFRSLGARERPDRHDDDAPDGPDGRGARNGGRDADDVSGEAAGRDAELDDELDDDDDDGDDDAYDPVWRLLSTVADAHGPSAVPVGAALLASPDPARRVIGCGLLTVAAERGDDAVRTAVADEILAVTPRTPDPAMAVPVDADTDVQWATARALGATRDRRAAPILTALADSPDDDVRCQTAVALPGAFDGERDGPVVRTLIRLTRDRDPEVRNWASFSLGSQVAADTPEIRAALADRLDDEDEEAREEGVRGLARRRDPRAVAPLAELLAAGSAYVLTFYAAEILGAPELLPHLEQYDPAGTAVADALRACDPVIREQDAQAAMRLFEALDRATASPVPSTSTEPGSGVGAGAGAGSESGAASGTRTAHDHGSAPDFALYGERLEPGLTLTAALGEYTRDWDVRSLLARADDDASAAARLALTDLFESR